jgi:hypothetical protein
MADGVTLEAAQRAIEAAKADTARRLEAGVAAL